ncbi:PAN domain-containing protein [Zea mays]|uniref:non-specific serine/threonine protein kinase n=1 Tax=Zea mays TaxID=4577 RepID=A0A1D6P728_MAIZE|nr:PAN domain-containing protein [Zea mays]
MVFTDYDGAAVWQADGNNFTGVQRAGLLNTGNLIIEDSGAHHCLTRLVPTTQSRSPGNYIFRFSDLPQVSDIYWPDPDQNIYQDGRNQYNCMRLGMLTDSRVLASSDFADDQALVASDVGPGVKRRLTLDPDGNLRLYSLNDSDGSWSVSMVAMTQPCNIHDLCGPNGICHYSPRPTCSCPPGYATRNPGISASVTAPVKAFSISKAHDHAIQKLIFSVEEPTQHLTCERYISSFQQG